MKRFFKNMLIGTVLGILLPGVLLTMAVHYAPPPETQVPVQTREPPKRQELTVLFRDDQEQVREMELDEYLTGVLLGEIPASFELEALKAQAVAARTYAWKIHETGGKHADGSICGNSRCCQAYMTREDYLDGGGTELGIAKMASAVQATSGTVLTYEGQLIEATYFSCSGGSTEDAQAVWGTDYPYLRSVDSPGEEKAARYRTDLFFSTEEFQKALGVRLEGNPRQWFSNVTFTSGGGVQTMDIGGTTYTGLQLRGALGLPSTAFTVTVEKDRIRITAHGYGHRVGMSQYGADAMAVTGSTWKQILAHYYPGTKPVQIRTVESGRS